MAGEIQQNVSGMSAGALEDILKTCFPLLDSSNTWVVLSICDYNPEDNMFLKRESTTEAWKAFKNTCEGKKMGISVDSAHIYLKLHCVIV